MSKNRFIYYNGTISEFQARADKSDFDNSIVFIKGGTNGTGAAIYTHGSYFANVKDINDTLDGLKYISKVKVGDTTAEATGKNAVLEFAPVDPTTIAVDASSGKVTIGLTDAFINKVDGKADVGTSSDEASSNTIYGVKKYADAAVLTAIGGLDSSAESSDGAKVKVKVTETDGKITAVNVTETDIASANILEQVKKKVDTFFENANMSETVDEYIDTLKELQTYIESDEALAAQFEQRITTAQNTALGAQTAVEALTAEVDKISLSGLGGITGNEVDGKIAGAIQGLDHTNLGSGNYVTAVSQTDGKVTVTYGTLPTYTLTTGSANGTVSFNGTDVNVKGLGSAAYVESGVFATAEQGIKAENAAPQATTYTKTEVDTIKTNLEAACAAMWVWEELN